jgi:hypothetical protein
MDKKRLKFYKVFISSDRIKFIRDMFGLSAGEYIVKRTPNHRGLITNRGKTIEVMKSDELGDHSAVTCYLKAPEIIQELILDYFHLDIDKVEATKVVLEGERLDRGFYSKFGLNENKKLELKVVFEVMPSADDLKELNKEIKYNIEYAESHFDMEHNKERRKNINTEFSNYKRVKNWKHFDEQFEIFQKYKLLRRQYPEGIPDVEREQLLERARATFASGREGYVIDDLRKDLNQFNKYFRILS